MEDVGRYVGSHKIAPVHARAGAFLCPLA
ncbi:hypothetical protein SEA_LINUS_102 [Arthrobacter phage Linus]|uniref:Uncharacterized protein n=1 Tax=Arthrobacter phage Linus TaxID=2601684 RepID=A0A5J6DAD2_9CAUD|nr:hypothetical protein SEA_LINUS_102 [Arthrobacter phage Linus]